jgi:hypothetical protein
MRAELSEQISSVGLIAVIWFNWESIKIINQHKKVLSRITTTIGLIVVLFSCLVILGGISRMILAGVAGWYVLSIFEIISGFTFLIQSVWCLKNDWKVRRNIIN